MLLVFLVSLHGRYSSRQVREDALACGAGVQCGKNLDQKIMGGESEHYEVKKFFAGSVACHGDDHFDMDMCSISFLVAMSSSDS
jgi:hypothetical protein